MMDRILSATGGEPRDPAGDDADRGLPDVGRRKRGSRIWYLVVVGVTIVLAVALAAMVGLNKLSERAQGDVTTRTPTVTEDQFALSEQSFERALQRTAPATAPASAPAPTPAPAATPAGPPAASGPPALTEAQQRARDLAERRKRAPVVAMSVNPGTTAGAPAGASGRHDAAGVGNASGSLGRALGATRTGAVSATLLADPNLTVTQGRLLPCTLETAINSGLPGMASCVLSRDVYSTNGRVLLLERGSRLVGQYQSGQMQGGASRIFLLWTRIETPTGVLINLDSPASDALGRPGIGGEVERHFWQRFGAALLVSMVEDVGEYAAARENSKSGNGGVSVGASSNPGQSAAGIIAGNTVDIPPTLDAAQGASLGVFVARDLYFGDVYTLQPRGVP